MANAIYLKIDGAPGLSKNKGHEGEIELESYSFGASQQSTMGHGGGGGSGKVQFDQFTFHAKVGKESPEVQLNPVAIRRQLTYPGNERTRFGHAEMRLQRRHIAPLFIEE